MSKEAGTWILLIFSGVSLISAQMDGMDTINFKHASPEEERAEDSLSIENSDINLPLSKFWVGAQFTIFDGKFWPLLTIADSFQTYGMDVVFGSLRKNWHVILGINVLRYDTTSGWVRGGREERWDSTAKQTRFLVGAAYERNILSLEDFINAGIRIGVAAGIETPLEATSTTKIKDTTGSALTNITFNADGGSYLQFFMVPQVALLHGFVVLEYPISWVVFRRGGDWERVTTSIDMQNNSITQREAGTSYSRRSMVIFHRGIRVTLRILLPVR